MGKEKSEDAPSGIKMVEDTHQKTVGGASRIVYTLQKTEVRGMMPESARSNKNIRTPLGKYIICGGVVVK